LIIFGIRSIYVIYKNQKEFDFLPVTLVALFVGHVAQSTISLHQIGISVWGWVLLGLLAAYSKNLKTSHVNIRNSETRKLFSKDEPWNVGIFIGTCIGLIISIPPFTAEAKLVSAIKSQDYAKVDSALQQSYFTPLNSDTLNKTIILLESNNLGEQALQQTRKAVKFNPDSFDSWKLLYYITKSTPSEKKQAKLNMKRLDPLNKKLEKLK
jgi:tetrahydromethanopterin S-methyltransferase subunit G